MKVIIFDVDGVLVQTFNKAGEFLWSANIKRDMGISGAVIRDIFATQGWSECIWGKTDTKAYFEAKLKERNVGINADTLIDYWLTNDSNFDKDVMGCVESLHGRRIFIATNQDKLRAAHLKETVGHLFEEVFASSHIGATKPEEKFYRHIEQTLNLKPENIIFIDDRLENVEAARRCGWEAHVYKSVTELKKVVGLGA